MTIIYLSPTAKPTEWAKAVKAVCYVFVNGRYKLIN